ncbi:MAG: hypothetical protein ABIX00_01335 [Polaromonas sp.]
MWQHAPGSAATLGDVVARYNTRQSPGLNAQQIGDLTEYLKSLKSAGSSPQHRDL